MSEQPAQQPPLKQQVEGLIRENPVLLFMKGTPAQPRCGFSMRVVNVLEAHGVEYGAVDVLPALQPLREDIARGPWPSRNLLFVPLSPPGVLHQQVSMLAGRSGVQVSISPQAGQPRLWFSGLRRPNSVKRTMATSFQRLIAGDCRSLTNADSACITEPSRAVRLGFWPASSWKAWVSKRFVLA